MTIIDQDNLLRTEFKRLQAEKKKRVGEYRQLVTQDHSLCEKLVLKRTEPRAHVPSETEIQALVKRVDELRNLLEKRKADMNALKHEIVNLSEDLELSQSDSFAEQLIFESIDELKLGEEDLKRAYELRDQLSQKQTEVIERIKSLRIKIKDLWSKLDIEITSDMKMLRSMVFDEVERDAPTLFPKSTLLNELTAEYERCHAIKMANMQVFVEGIRADICELMEKMYLNKEEHIDELLSSVDYNEELLAEHEKQLEELRFVYTESREMFEKTALWVDVWAQYVAFEEKTKDPQRFKQRGYNMLEEERQRKVFKVQLPKLEEEITLHAAEYAEANQKPFCIYGMPYVEFIEHKKTTYEENKLNERYRI